MLCIQGAELFLPEGKFAEGYLEVDGGVICRVETDRRGKTRDTVDNFSGERHDGGEVLDGAGYYAIPGLIDIHFHGCMGADFCDGSLAAIDVLSRYEASVGVTAICPATLTLPADKLGEIVELGAAYRERAQKAAGADLVGINMEGPFISRAKKGAQNEQYILPCSAELALSFVERSKGLVKIIGLAPEENPDFAAYIDKVKGHVRISLAHTAAEYDEAKRAFDHGASHVVHLYNAMSPFTHRDPGVIGAAADSSHVFCELICDGIHVHPSAVRAAYRLMGKDRIVLVSDSLRATGMGEGIIDLGGQAVQVSGRKATLVEDGHLAGSVTNLADCLRIAVQDMGIPLEEAVQSATQNAAKAIGIDTHYGSLDVGKKGHVVLLRKEDLALGAVIKDGEILINHLQDIR